MTNLSRKIICITPIKHIEGAIEALQKCGEVIYDPYIAKTDLKNRIIYHEIDTIFSNPCKQTFKIDEELLAGTNVDTICTASTGTDHIAMDYCKINNIEVLCLAKDYEILETITSTAEMAFTLMLALIRNLPKAVEGVSRYEWDYEKYRSRQLDHLRVGIIGYGRLGEIYAKFCDPFFADVIVTDPYKDVGNRYLQVELDELLYQSDVIALHIHLNKETYHMINEEAINKMKDGAYLVNTSRGDIVDEKAVIAAIRRGKIKGYAADVISGEYQDDVSESAMINAMNEGLNIVISPHISGTTKEAQKIAYLYAISKLAREDD
jgi:D-3-phosphoglycerate dehydrogenase / 2-oxoglutarate reductase